MMKSKIAGQELRNKILNFMLLCGKTETEITVNLLSSRFNISVGVARHTMIFLLREGKVKKQNHLHKQQIWELVK